MSNDPQINPFYWRAIGPIADPPSDLITDKSILARLKVAQLDSSILELSHTAEACNKQMDYLKMQRQALVEQYKLR